MSGTAGLTTEIPGQRVSAGPASGRRRRVATWFDRDFETKGVGQSGFGMQDDVTEGTRWPIDRKLAEPSRICIAGGSHGGDAALEGVEKEWDLDRCAAAWAPVTNLLDREDEMKRTLYGTSGVDILGDDKDRLEAASPALHADRIKDAGKPVEAIDLDRANHYRLHYPARLAWRGARDRFLGANPGKW